MAGVIWSRPYARTDKLFFVDLKTPKLVYMLASPDEFHVIRLHYLETLKTSAPCFDDECPHCPLPARDYCYAPCLVFGKNSGRWYNAILPVGDPSHGLATVDYKGEMLTVGKPRKPDETQRAIVYGTVKTAPVPLPHIKPAFDVRPHLLRRWGLFKEADLIGCDLHSPPQEQQERVG